jgi:hypothetical protein
LREAVTVKLLFIGELDVHQTAFLPFLNDHGYEITVVNTSHWKFPGKVLGTAIPIHNLYEHSKMRFLFDGRMGWFRKAAFYSLAKRLKFTNCKIKPIIKQAGIDLIYGSWGSHSLPEIRSVQDFNVPTIYEFLTYPTNIVTLAEKAENTLNRHTINRLNGRVLATHRMLNYLKIIFGISHGKNLVFTECYSKHSFYKTRLARLSENADGSHVIFTGFNVHEVLPQLETIMKKGIHVHVCETKGTKQMLKGLKFNRFCHTFKKFDCTNLLDGTFATFMTQFDACLVTYDFRKVSTLNRFFNGVPNRFSLALTAGIPIIMPKGYLKGCEDIITRHQIGFTYVGYDDLKGKLNQIKLMDNYRHNAIAKSKLFTLEHNFEKIDGFLKDCLMSAQKN